MFENPRRGRQARNFTTTNVPKNLDPKLSSERIFLIQKLSLGTPVLIVSGASFLGFEAAEGATKSGEKSTSRLSWKVCCLSCPSPILRDSLLTY